MRSEKKKSKRTQSFGPVVWSRGGRLLVKRHEIFKVQMHIRITGKVCLNELWGTHQNFESASESFEGWRMVLVKTRQ